MIYTETVRGQYVTYHQKSWTSDSVEVVIPGLDVYVEMQGDVEKARQMVRRNLNESGTCFGSGAW